MPMTPAVIVSFAVAVAAFMLSLGFFLGTCWAAIHNGEEPPLRDTAIRAGRPLKAADLDRDRCRSIEHG
jgi:hypothetical protein